MPPRLRPMIVYAANSVIASRADPAGGGMPPAPAVGRVREAAIWIVAAGPIGERNRPTGLESLHPLQCLYQRRAGQVAARLARRLREHHRGGPRMLGVDVERLELAWVVVLDRAEVLAHRGVPLVVVRRQERHERMGVTKLSVV